MLFQNRFEEESEADMSKNRYQTEEIIRSQREQSVCAGFAFPCHFLS